MPTSSWNYIFENNPYRNDVNESVLQLVALTSFDASTNEEVIQKLKDNKDVCGAFFD